MSKRQEIREKRKRQEQLQRLMIIVGVALVALVIAGMLIIPNLNPPEVVSVTPYTDLPNVNGKEMGDPNAKVVIEVWEDFQCPSCARYGQEIEPQVIENLIKTGKARYIFHNYPFIGAESQLAANAAMCAAEQGKFWDFKKVVFTNQNGENQGWFTDARMRAFATNVGLDMTKFNSCYAADTYKNDINDDFTLGQQVGVNGTPSVFVNRVPVSPGYIPSYDDIAKAVDAAAAAGQ